MTVNRTTESPLASAEVADAVRDGAYAVEVNLWSGRDRMIVTMTADEAAEWASEIQGAAVTAINTYRADNPPAEPFDADPDRDGHRYAWVSREGVTGLGLHDRLRDEIAWWTFPPTEETRRTIYANLQADPVGESLRWSPSIDFRPFEIAVFG